MSFEDNIWRDGGRNRSDDRYGDRYGDRFDSRYDDRYDDRYSDRYDRESRRSGSRGADDRSRSTRSSRNSRDLDGRSSRGSRSMRSGGLLEKIDSIDSDSLFADRDAGSSRSGSSDRSSRDRSSRAAGGTRGAPRASGSSSRGPRSSGAAESARSSRRSSSSYDQRGRQSTYDPYDLYGGIGRSDTRSRRISERSRSDGYGRYERYGYDDRGYERYGYDDRGYDDRSSNRRSRGDNGHASDTRGRGNAGRGPSALDRVKDFFVGLPAAAVDFAHAVVDRFGLVAAIIMGAVAIVLATLLVSGLVGFVTNLPPLFGAGGDEQAAQEEDETPIDEQALTDLIGSGFAKELVSAAENDTDVRWIAAHPDEYASFGSDLQQKVIKLAATEPEAVHFARVFPYDYPASKPNTGADHADSSKNGVPVLYQWDERWGFTEYDSSAFAFTGNFPTALSMVCQTIKGDAEATPYAIGQSLASQNIALTDGQLKTIPASEKQIGSSTVVETAGANGESGDEYYDEGTEQVDRYDEDGNYDVNGEYDADGYYIGSPYDDMGDGSGDSSGDGENGDSSSTDGDAKEKDAEKEAETVDSEPVEKAAKMLGLNYVELPVGELTLKEALKSQQVVLLYVGPGDFTETGHFIVATGMTEDGKVSLCDPFSAVRTNQDWDVNTLILQTKAVYGFDRKQTTSSTGSTGTTGTSGANSTSGTNGAGSASGTGVAD